MGRGAREPVQVDLAFDGEFPASQSPEHVVADARPPEDVVVVDSGKPAGRCGADILVEHATGAREARLRPRLGKRRGGCGRRQRLDAAHGPTEVFRVFVRHRCTRFQFATGG